jgi:hypothetical protein
MFYSAHSVLLELRLQSNMHQAATRNLKSAPAAVHSGDSAMLRYTPFLLVDHGRCRLHSTGGMMTFDSRPAAHVHASITLTLSSLSAVLLLACGAEAIVGVSDGRSRTVVASVGQEIDVKLGNVGPATYESPPTISSSAVSFLGAEDVPPYTPAGATQRFRFKANNAGQAILTFRRVLGDSLVAIVEDTVVVR